MNKKIKVIELLNKIANGEDLPKRIKIQDYVFELSKDYEHYYYNEDVEITHLINHNFSNLNDEVEILEDNTEEIEELDKQKAKNEIWTYTDANINKSNLYCLSLYTEHHIVPKINELVKAVNKLRKENNNGKRRK